MWGPLGEVGCGAHERSESSSFARETRKSAGGLEALNPPRGVRGAAPEFYFKLGTYLANLEESEHIIFYFFCQRSGAPRFLKTNI